MLPRADAPPFEVDVTRRNVLPSRWDLVKVGWQHGKASVADLL